MCPLSHLHSPYQAIIIKVSNDDVTFHLSLPLNSLQLTAAQLTLSVDWLSCTLDRRLEFKQIVNDAEMLKIILEMGAPK